ncbi:MAG: hypothetical protein FJ033_06950 [Chloroflexi bacterium]|nr:hypothetical protein [Chloroflexota bacterium]
MRVDCALTVPGPSAEELAPRLPDRWRGVFSAVNDRRDPPAARTDDLQRRLDEAGLDGAVLVAAPSLSRRLEHGFAEALALATNGWLIETYLDRATGLRGTIFVATIEASIVEAEIARCARTPFFAQVRFPTGGGYLAGHHANRPLFVTAARQGLPVLIDSHGGERLTGVGPVATTLEIPIARAHALQAHLTSAVFHGILPSIPALRLIVAQPGIQWAADMVDRLDRTWNLLGAEIPEITVPPSRQIAEWVWWLDEAAPGADSATVGEIIRTLPGSRGATSPTRRGAWDSVDPALLRDLYGDRAPTPVAA